MNNKIIAGIAAMAISASLMSTVAFAADPTLKVSGDTATLSFKVGENGADISESLNEDQITMMAYLVDAAAETVPAYTNQKIVALDQADGGTGSGFGDVLIDAAKLEAGKKVAVVLGGSDGSTESFFALEDAPTVTYTSALQDVTYNNIDATIVRITGLDTTKVATVDGVTAKYYTKTDGTLVHVACVPRNATPVITVADGTPELIKFGDVDGTGSVVAADKTEMGRCIAGYERQKPTYKKYELPTDLMLLLAYDVDGSGSITASDKTELGRAIAGYERQKPTYKKFSLETMGCYTK